MEPEEILELYDELGRPSTTKFARVLRKRGMKVTDEDVQKNIVGLQGERQLRAPSPRYKGKIFSLGIDEKWVADIMVIPPGRHALIVQDVFSRFLWARKMNSQADVVDPMRDIMKVRKPRVLYTDADVAFRSKAFRAAMADLGVDFRVKQGRNDIATVDRAIGLLGETIVRYTTSSGEGDWMKHLDRAVKAFNHNDLEYLANEAPKDVTKGSELEEFLRRKNQQFMEQNIRLRASRTNRLTDVGTFRTYLPPPRTGKRRVGDPRWSSEVHQVAGIKGSVVVDESGRQHPINEVLPVAAQSTKPLLLGRGLDLNRFRRKEALEAQRIELETALESAGGEETVRNLAHSLRQTDFFDVLRREGIGDRRAFESFVGLFPTTFAFTGSGAARSIRLR